jgi:hypothetical protein
MLLDNVLQQMFLNFLDVIIEDRLPSYMFGCRRGRNIQLAVASVFFRLNQVTFFQNISICSVEYKNIYFNILHSAILSRFPFPKKYISLLKRWLQCSIIDKASNFKDLGISQRGISQYMILGPVIVNYIIYTVYLKTMLFCSYFIKRKYQINLFSYIDSLVVIFSKEFNKDHMFLYVLEKNLKSIGISFKQTQKEYITNIKKRVSFTFLGFMFILVPFVGNKKNIIQKRGSRFFFQLKIFLKPQLNLFFSIKKCLKNRISLIQSASIFQI